MSHPESGMYLQAVPDTDADGDNTTRPAPTSGSRDGKSRPAAPSPFAPPRTSPSSGDQDQDQAPGSTKPTKPTPAAEPANNTGGQGQGTPAATTATPATGGQNPTAAPTGTIPAPAAGPDNPVRTTPGQASKTINDAQSTPDPAGDAARAKPAANGTGKGTGTGDPAAGQAPQIDPSKMLSLATPAITALSTIPQLALTMPLSLLGALTAPLSAILAQFGKGTPSTPAQSTLPSAANANLQQAATGTSNWTGAGAGAHTTANQTGQNKTQALGTLDAKLKALLEKSGDKTSEGRQKVEGIINQVNTSLQSLGPVANTPAGQAQILSTLTTAIQQAGAVLADSSSSSGGNAAELQSIATQYLADTAATTSPTAQVQGASVNGESPLASLTPSSSREEIARAIIAEAQRRGYSPEQTVAILAFALDESGLDANADGGVQGSAGRVLGVFQQGEGYGPNRGHPAVNINGFFDRMDSIGGGPNSGTNIYQAIVGLQQHNGGWQGTSGDQWYLGQVQRYIGNAQQMYQQLTTPGIQA